MSSESCVMRDDAMNNDAGWRERLARRLLLDQLKKASQGEMRFVEGSQQFAFGQRSADCDLHATVTVRDPRFYSNSAFGGSVGAAEAYMQGFWECDDLVALVRLLLRNREALDGMDGGAALLTRPKNLLMHWLNRNNRRGSRRNIAAHYDLGNELFELFLDPHMMYSSAVYPTTDATLEEAATCKLALICDKLQLTPGDHLLEIGTGWGGMAVYAAQHYGCRVTTTTISREQHDSAVQRVIDAGLTDRVRVLLCDYRDLGTGRMAEDGGEVVRQFDKLVSIEMIEAVGHQYYDVFFRKCGELLKPDGMMLIQAITIAENRYESARRSVDFIQKYIFPGGCLPSVSAMTGSIASQTDMHVVHLEDFGHDYARTLRDWRVAFLQRLDAVTALGYDQTFIRMWLYYLCYCEGAFLERAISNVHLVGARQGRRSPTYSACNEALRTRPRK